MAIVPEGIDLTEWDAFLRTPPVRRDERPTILSVARQYPRKNTRLLIDAMPAIRAAIPEVRLRVVGGGPMLPNLQEQAIRLGVDESVEFVGEVNSDNAVRREFFLADVFCLPSLQEGFGIVFLEAMAAGLPIVAARAAAVPEVIPHGEVAMLVPPGDSESLAGAVVRLLRDQGLAARFASAGKKRVRGYDWPEVAAAFLKEIDFGEAPAFEEK
jgi:glycosyltransferase involved in cell wall biosynthesis